MLESVYGSVILPINSIVYHTTDEEFINRPEKSLLFCTFHPSEWEGVNEYVVKIKLKRELKLLFMISSFHKHFIYSSLDNLSNNRNYMSKLSEKKRKCFVKKLKKENFDGWFSSIENKSQIEIAIINDNVLYSVISFENLRRNWRNGNNLNNIITKKNWGNIYDISSINLPITFNINDRYKNMIEEYIKYGLKSKYPYEYIFQIILNNAKINYHKAKFINIDWNC